MQNGMERGDPVAWKTAARDASPASKGGLRVSEEQLDRLHEAIVSWWLQHKEERK